MSQDCHSRSRSHTSPLYLPPSTQLGVYRQCRVGALHSPWMLSIWPSFRAAPRTLHSVLTIRSAFASDRKGLESSTAFFPEGQKGSTQIQSLGRMPGRNLHDAWAQILGQYTQLLNVHRNGKDILSPYAHPPQPSKARKASPASGASLAGGSGDSLAVPRRQQPSLYPISPGCRVSGAPMDCALATRVLAAVRTPSSSVKDSTTLGHCFSPLPHSLARPAGS